ncbi:hypothetical protein BFP72_15005 [Reichenbachiella sp. 5M10]|nr:hypothetical protein BFP72_15005 [Reichenbachiella sp. 5M10]
MKLIWYNSEIQAYGYGESEDYLRASNNARDPQAVSVLMKFDHYSQHLTQKILKQLNIRHIEIDETPIPTQTPSQK